jgi:hypothetical protein
MRLSSYLPLFLGALLVGACGHHSSPPIDCNGLLDAGICSSLIPIEGTDLDAGHNHVSIGTPVMYDTNPPCAGDHWPVWAVWGTHSSPVPPEYFVHNLEHGGVVLLYNCPQGCPDILLALECFVQSQPVDPLCASAGNGVDNRFVITPDPDLDGTWAAAAWGYYILSSEPCVDVDALGQFVTAHYGNGREALCAQGLFQ